MMIIIAIVVVVLLSLLLILRRNNYVDDINITRKLQGVLIDTNGYYTEELSSRNITIENYQNELKIIEEKLAMLKKEEEDLHEMKRNIEKKISSPRMIEYISRYPIEWRIPIKLCIVADESYIAPIDIFYKTILSFGFSSLDISIFCITSECTRMLKQIDIDSELIQVDECATAPMKRIKCLISLGKARVIHTTLSKGFSVFFFDLDIYFRESPLHNFIPESHIEIYAQDNDDNTANYGCILIKPTSVTIAAFKDLETDALNDVWDQQLMNNQIQKHQIPFAFFDRNQYYLFLHRIEIFPSNMNLIHMICVEGPLNKMLVGRQRVGGFNTPFLYTQNKVIAIHVDYNSPEHKTSFSQRQLVAMIQLLVEISKKTNRYIRLAGWRYYNPVKSLFDADFLFLQYNVTLVEGNYWENFKLFNDDFNVTTINYAINNTQDYGYFLKSHSESVYDNYSEIFFHFTTAYLDNNYDSNYEQALCKFYDDFSIGCTRTCSGNHFRFRN